MDKSQLTVKRKNYSPLIGLVIASITFLIYLPALKNGFVNWDDNAYVYENPNIQSVDLNFFRWSLAAEVAALWHPLTMFSLALDYAVWELNPLGYHLTNILIHSLNTFLVFILVVRLIKCKHNPSSFAPHPSSLIAASVTALLFGIHPLRVESVVWVSERKDVLCAFFFLLSILAYLRYVRTPKKRLFYVTSLISFSLALISKPMAVSLPLVLLILDFYPFRRLMAEGGVLREKIPFLALSLLASLIAIWAQNLGGALRPLEEYPLAERILIAVRAFAFYLIKMILPSGLAPYYPHPIEIDLFAIEYIGSFISIILITTLSILSLKRFRLFSAVWFYYIVTLIPVIGIVKVGGHSMADRYAYLPSLGPSILVGVGIATVFEKYIGRIRYKVIITVALALLLSIFAYKSVRQIAVWHDSITLWSHQIKVFPQGTSIAYTNRGLAFDSLGNYRRAIEDYDKAIEVNPQDVQAYYNRGNDYNYIGEYRQAINDLSTAIELNPRDAKTYTNRGIAYYNAGGYQQAIADYNTAIRINPQDALAYYNMGLVYARLGDTEQAFYYKKAAGLGLKQASEPAKSGERKPSFR